MPKMYSFNRRPGKPSVERRALAYAMGAGIEEQSGSNAPMAHCLITPADRYAKLRSAVIEMAIEAYESGGLRAAVIQRHIEAIDAGVRAARDGEVE